MNFSSKLLEEAVKALSTLPGVGKKTALRLALHLIQQPEEQVKSFSEAILTMRRQIKHCRICFNLSDDLICNICKDTSRIKKIICVVESARDVMAIEDTNQYRGTYHVLGGIISPLEGIGPSALHIDGLIQRVEHEEVEEVIMAISPTIEGETTLFYLSRQLQPLKVKISTIARGVAFGGELEYADELTLGRSIISRIPYSSDSDE
jgi:recombination protein RecR